MEEQFSSRDFITGDDSPANETDSSVVVDKTNSFHLTLTLRATGPATYKRRIKDSKHVDGVAIHQDIAVTLSRVLPEPSELCEFVELDHRGKPSVDQEAIIDQRLTDCNQGYFRLGSVDEWTITYFLPDEMRPDSSSIGGRKSLSS